MAVYFDFLRATQRQLSEALTFNGHGRWPSIDKSSIVIRHLPHRMDSRSVWRDEATPGIIISPARKITRNGGWNSHDYWEYPVLVQFIDRCEDSYNEDALQSWLAWEEAAVKFYHNTNAQQETWDVGGYLFHTWTSDTDVFEEQKMDFHHHMVMAFTIVGQSVNPRDSDGAK